jgi:excisionase family DNA binding protein
MQVEATQLFKVKDVAGLFAVSPATVYRLVESGTLPALRFGKGKGALRISGAAVNAYLVTAATLAKQADGMACVVCGADYLTVTVAHLPVGTSDTGSQVFACVGACAERAIADRVSPALAERVSCAVTDQPTAEIVLGRADTAGEVA